MWRGLSSDTPLHPPNYNLNFVDFDILSSYRLTAVLSTQRVVLSTQRVPQVVALRLGAMNFDTSGVSSSSGGSGVASSLKSDGFASLYLQQESVEVLHKSLFSKVHKPLDLCSIDDDRVSNVNGSMSSSSSSSSSSSTFTGLHSMGGLSAYNVNREGFVFSNGDLMQLPTPFESFESDCEEFRAEGCAIARR